MLKGIRFFIREGWKYDKKYVLWMVFSELLSALTPIAAALMPKFIIDELMGAKRVEYLVCYVALFAGYALLSGALNSYFLKDGFTRRCQVGKEFDMRMNRRLIQADYPDIESPDFRDMKQKAEKFLTCDWHGFGYLLDCAIRIMGQMIALAGLMTILSTLHIGFVLFFAALALISAQVESRARKKAMALSMGIVRCQRGMMYYSKVFDHLAFAKEIRLHGIGDWVLAHFEKFYNHSNACIKKQNDLFIRSGVLRSGLAFLQQTAAYAFLIIRVLSGAMGVGDFTMCVTAVTALAEALRKMMDSVAEIRAYDLYYEKLDEYLFFPCHMREGKGLPIPEGDYEIVLDDVSFRYPGAEKWALRHISFTLHPGEKLSLVGENGSGKTTLIKLLCRLYDPTEGTIRLNGVDIRELHYDRYMALFSAVLQDYQLFDLPLRDNIALNREADDARIIALCHQVGLGERLAHLPKGLSTYVGRELDEQGFLPSGGEAQKIALARALYRNAPILILDEPTAALDPRAEYNLYKTFHSLTGGKSTVYISHRLSSARFCDTIAVLEKGRLAEYGTHRQLMEKKGRYAALYAMQAQYYTD